ncbi:tetratricopeptide repeat protein [Myxococcota bacterium]|nr:tetratricopeptide repeat protein [Myxococcota bacterium]
MAFFLILLLLSAGEISCERTVTVSIPPHITKRGAYAFQRGVAALRAGSYRYALAWFQEVHRYSFSPAQTATGEGLALAGMEKLQGAKAAFTRAIALDPRRPEPYIRRGLIFHHWKKYPRALADFNRGLRLRPGHPLGLMGRSFTLYSMGRYGEALVDALAAQRAGMTLPHGYVGSLKAN